MRFRFSPARADATEPLAHALETADRAEEAIEWGRDNISLDSPQFKQPRAAMWLQRFWAGAGGVSLCVVASLMTTAVQTASAGEPQHWFTIGGVLLFGASSICFMKLAQQYGEGIFHAFERERQHLEEAAVFASAFARLEAKEATEIANELALSLKEVTRAYRDDFRTYRAAVAAETTDDEAGAEFPSSVVYINGTPRRDH